MEYAVKAMSRKEIRSIASLIRKLQNSKGEVYFDIMDFLEHTLPHFFPNFTLSVGTKEEMGNCHGLTFPGKNEIQLREDVYDGAMAGNGRDRLTAAHELFHFLVHSQESIAFARTSTKKIPSYMSSEWQADAFGGELLIPYDLTYDLEVDEIVERCGVSRSAAMYQYRMMHGM